MRGRAAAVLAAGALSLAPLSTPSARAQEAPPAPADAAGSAASEAAEATQPAGELRVRVSALLAEVWVDGARAGYTVGPALFVSPGQHVVEIRAAGYLPERREISIAAGEAQEISVTLTRSPPGPPLRQEPATPEPISRVAPPPAALGAGLPLGALYQPSRPQRRGKSVPFILGGLSSAAMLGVLGGALVGITDSPESQAMGAGFLIGGGALAIGTITYALWPQASPRSAGVAVSGAF